MKFVCEGFTLSSAASIVSKACSTKTTIPVLECIRLKAENDTLTLTAYDGEISIEKNIKSDVLEEGEICVNGKFFTDFIGKINNSEITIYTSDNGIKISYNESESFMQSLPASDFPKINKDEETTTFFVKNNDFKKIISKTVFCCATDDSRPILKGCLFEIEGNKLFSTSLDGFRMAVSETEIKAEGESKIVCPARTLIEISRMIEDEGELEVVFSKNTLSVCVNGTELISRLFRGEYVNKNNIFPSEFKTTTTLKKSDIISSVERAAILMRGDKNNLIVMEVKANIILITANSEIGKVSESVECNTEGPEIKIAMNAKYISDALKALDEEKIKISFNAPTSPFTIENEENKQSKYLILPVRMNL